MTKEDEEHYRKIIFVDFVKTKNILIRLQIIVI